MENSQTPPQDLYIGTQKVVQYWPSEKANSVPYMLENGYHDDCTLRQWKGMAKTAPYPDSDVPLMKWNQALGEILQILMDEGMKINDKDFLFTQLDNRVVNNVDLATAKMFGKEVPGQITLAQVHAVLVAAAVAEVEEEKQASEEVPTSN